MTSNEALLWLAGLERPCPTCGGKGVMGGEPDFVGDWVAHTHYECLTCNGSCKVPVLDLREPCPRGNHSNLQRRRVKGTPLKVCEICSGSDWIPKSGLASLYAAMQKAGWDYIIKQIRGQRCVRFWKLYPITGFKDQWYSEGIDSEDYLAAIKAVKSENDKTWT